MQISVPCATIGHALSKAVDNVTIHVATGTYVENSLIITINVNIIAEQGAVVNFVSLSGFEFKSQLPTLTGFTIKNAGQLSCLNCAAIYIHSGSSPRITNCTITQSASQSGGAITIIGNSTNPVSSPYFENCVVQYNSASSGGGIYVSDAFLTFIYGLIQFNSAARGGGIFCSNCTLSLYGTIINQNEQGNVLCDEGIEVNCFACGECAKSGVCNVKASNSPPPNNCICSLNWTGNSCSTQEVQSTPTTTQPTSIYVIVGSVAGIVGLVLLFGLSFFFL